MKRVTKTSTDSGRPVAGPGAEPAAKRTTEGRRRSRGASPLASERREHLVKLAAELFAEKGFQATTVRNIADEAGILSGSLYHHFDSKESIVDEILSSFFDELMSANRAAAAQSGDPRQVITELVKIAFGVLEPHRAAITVMQNDWNYLRSMDRFQYLIRAEDEVEDVWVDSIEQGQRNGLFRADMDPRLTYRMIRDTIWVTVRWFQPGGPFRAQDLSDHYLSVLFDGICTH
jgi:AcrR family transcriptional regulator